jgi:hypothetical protein
VRNPLLRLLKIHRQKKSLPKKEAMSNGRWT